MIDGAPAASGGGASTFFSKPSWQTGTGVPSDGARDVPDVALPASADHDGYMVYTTSGKQTAWYIFGGTSCGAPTFSGILALLNHYLVANGYQPGSGLGNVNTQLYRLGCVGAGRVPRYYCRQQHRKCAYMRGIADAPPQAQLRSDTPARRATTR